MPSFLRWQRAENALHAFSIHCCTVFAIAPRRSPGRARASWPGASPRWAQACGPPHRRPLQPGGTPWFLACPIYTLALCISPVRSRGARRPRGGGAAPLCAAGGSCWGARSALPAAGGAFTGAAPQFRLGRRGCRMRRGFGAVWCPSGRPQPSKACTVVCHQHDLYSHRISAIGCTPYLCFLHKTGFSKGMMTSSIQLHQRQSATVLAFRRGALLLNGQSKPQRCCVCAAECHLHLFGHAQGGAAHANASVSGSSSGSVIRRRWLSGGAAAQWGVLVAAVCGLGSSH